MIATAAFALGFIIIGLTVVLLAMRGGPRGARQAMHTQTARGRTTAAGIIAAIALIFGVGLPAAVLASRSGTDKNSTGGVKLTASEARGRELFTANCGTCHTLKAASTSGRVGPNMDELRPPKALVLDAIEHGRARGNGQMGAQLVIGQDAQDVAAFVAKAVGKSGQK